MGENGQARVDSERATDLPECTVSVLSFVEKFRSIRANVPRCL